MMNMMFNDAVNGFIGMMSFFGQMMSTFFDSMFAPMQQFFDSMMH